MGKKKKKKKLYLEALREEMKEIRLQEELLHKRRRELMAACQHRVGKEFTIEYEGKTKVRCRQCNSRFSLKTFNEDEIREAAKILNSALQQVRILADPEEDAKKISTLGKLAADITLIPEIYKRHLERYGKNGDEFDKKKKKDRHSYDDLGGYNGIIEIMEEPYGKKKK